MSNTVLERVRSRLHPVQGLFREGRFVARASCAGCGAHEEWTSQKMPEPDVVKKKLEDRGWTLKRRPTCPSCQPKKEASVTVTPVPTAPSTDTRAALRLLSRVLDEEAYDHASQRYKPGFSDAGLAKDTGLSEKVVASERERLCGPAGEPPEVLALWKEMRALQAGADAMKEEVAMLAANIMEATRKFTELRARNGFRA